ncbi:MAG: ATP-binding protein [Myxococcota bacterium]
MGSSDVPRGRLSLPLDVRMSPAAFAAAGLCAGFSLLYLGPLQLSHAGAWLGTMTVLFVLVALAPRIIDENTAGTVFAIVVLLAVGGLSFLRGGFRPVVLLIAVFLPVASVFVARRFRPRFWVAAIIVEFTVLALLEHFGYAPISPAPHPLSELLGALCVLAILMYLSFAISRSLVKSETQRVALEQRVRHGEQLEALGRLAGGIAHDFNNLLSVIQSHTELALDSLPAEAQTRADVVAVRRAARRGSSLARDLLAFARREPVQPVAVELRSVVRRAAGLCQRLLRDNVILTVQEPIEGTVYVDAAQIEQVLMNLCVNAQDAMPDGGDIFVASSSIDLDSPRAVHHGELPAGRYAALCVRDTGDGIPREVLHNIFEPFYTTKVRGRGTGLGLSSVDGIIEQHGGAVDVTTERGAGTTFTVYLPLSDRPVVAETAKAPERTATARRRVLLVEDSLDVRDALRKLLTRAGHDVIAHGSGEKALRWAEDAQPPPDVMLTDVLMPGLSGTETVRRIRELHGALPVVFVSGHVEDELDLDSLPSGPTKYIRKPAPRAVLLEAIASVTERAAPP